jgi:diguanylate cyclase (GGDEF)-like protein/PAS domain S-box-containing protein
MAIKKVGRGNGVRREIARLRRKLRREKRRATELHRRAEHKYRLIINATAEGFVLLDGNQRITDVNRPLLVKLGYQRSQMLGRLIRDFYDTKRIGFYAASPDHLSFETWFQTNTGGWVPLLFNRSVMRDDDGAAAGYIAFLTDLTELKSEKKKAEEKLRRSREKYRHQAIHDNLTGLHNTRYMYQALDRLISQSKANQEPFSLIFMDMDNFKRVVDTYGHLNGSRALQEVAATIKSNIEPPAFGVAYGGDEFVVILPGKNKFQARRKAEDIRRHMKESRYLVQQGHDVPLGASFGVATFPDDAVDRTNLLALADRAMFRIKEKGKDAVGI